ncbi:MAG: hypothetical protein K2H96_06280 [Muribaculaceae bacterium]|nr:hypothetical protein [Muribaculaceae bacterium]
METIIKLQEMLTLQSKPENCSYSDYFKEIADLLLNNCAITKGERKYEIVEIEFYFFASDHQDVITYPRKMAAGQWYFHQSGVDLTFASNDKQFGGILLRGIKPLTPSDNDDSTGMLILGPQKCVDELWDSFDAFKPEVSEYPTIIEDTSLCKDEGIKEYKRWINIPEEKKRLKISDWSKRVVEHGFTLSYNDDERIDQVFNSIYRFVKEKAMDKHTEEWKKYSAKPK